MNKKIFYFSHYNPSIACVRYRGKYLLQNLKKDTGTNFTFIYPEYTFKMISKFILAIIEIIFSSSQNIIINQKIYRQSWYSSILLFLVRNTKKKSIYDIDDAYFVNHGDLIINSFIKHSDLTIAGSSELKNYAIKLNPNSIRIPSCILEQSSINLGKPNRFTVGFVGSINYYLPVLLDQVFPAIISCKVPLRFILLGINRPNHKKLILGYFKNTQNIEVIIPEIENWENEQYVYNWIKTFTVGLSPLSSSVIDQCKSAFKLKQYMACGVPSLASNIGENKNVINHNQNGLICNSKTEFHSGLIKFNQMANDTYVNYQSNCLNTIKDYTYSQFTRNYNNVIK